MKKLLTGLIAILLLTLHPIPETNATGAKSKGPIYASGTRAPVLDSIVDFRNFEFPADEDETVIRVYQVIRPIFRITWTGVMEGESFFDETIIESPDKLTLTFHGFDTFRGTIAGRRGTVVFKVTGTIRLKEDEMTGEPTDEGVVEGRFEVVKATGRLRNLKAQGIYQREHDQSLSVYSLIYEFRGRD